MPASSDHSPTASARDEALAWFVRLHSGDASAGDHDAFARWAAANPRHRQEFDRLCGVWRDLDALPDPRPRHRPVTSRRHFLAGAAGALGGAVVAGAVAIGNGTPLAGGERTATGERRSILAADGSRIDLDAGSAVVMEFTPALRRIRLLEGRAQFTVAGDPSRPFEVVCADGAARALGTVFTVHRRPRDVAVAVQESAVSVSLPAEGPATAHVRVAAGHKVTYGATGLGPAVAADGTETAWQRGRLVFEGMPLSDVVADLDRYRPGRTLLWGDALDHLRVSGVFDAARPDDALAAIVATLPVERLGVTPWLTVLRPL